MLFLPKSDTLKKAKQAGAGGGSPAGSLFQRAAAPHPGADAARNVILGECPPLRVSYAAGKPSATRREAPVRGRRFPAAERERNFYD